MKHQPIREVFVGVITLALVLPKKEEMEQFQQKPFYIFLKMPFLCHCQEQPVLTPNRGAHVDGSTLKSEMGELNDKNKKASDCAELSALLPSRDQWQHKPAKTS